MRLYEEVDLIENAINEFLDTEEPVDIDALNNLIQAKTDTIERGLEKLCKIRANKLAEIAALKQESARMIDRAKTEEKRISGLENYILSLLKMSGEKKVAAGTFTVGTRMSNSVYVAPDFSVAEFMRTTTTSAPDKIAIKEAIAAGRQVPGAYITTKENLAIK